MSRTLYCRRLSALTLPLLAPLAAAPTAQAAVVLQTANLSAINLFTVNPPSNAIAFTVPIAASFTAFDASLGTLTGVGFAYNYNDAYVQEIQGDGGGGGGAVNSGLRINGTVFGVSSGSLPGLVGLASSVAVTYTYDEAPAVVNVPEPAALALVLTSGMALALQRRRAPARLGAPALPALA